MPKQGGADQISVWFEERVLENSDALAVIAGDQNLSYGELNHRANRLAHLLRAQGVGPETPIALCAKRSPLALVGLLGIWKAGGAYVPLDPSHPSQWIRYILDDTGASLLLTETSLEAAFAQQSARVICIDNPGLEAYSADNPTSLAGADNLAYCIYTSGTTGQPKGVMVSHRSLINHSLSMRRLLALQGTDRVLQMTPMTVDAALEEMLPTWLAGAAVVLPPHTMFPGAGFTRFLDRSKVSVVSLPTSLWHRWVDAEQSQTSKRPDCLRLVFVGGEPVCAEKLRRWQALPWTEELSWVVDYGPTEATISCSTYRVSGPLEGDCVPIGQPIDGVVLHVLDTELDAVADGEIGEIWIGEGALARGYLGRRGLTADAFRPDPWGAPGNRMYRSGDLGRRLPDGNLVFLGRRDEQVKYLGHRLELGAIESRLARCNGVREAAVALHKGPSDDAHLVAYLVGNALDPESIRSELDAQLPQPMRPSHYVLLDDLPCSPISGKLDRSRLPIPPSIHEPQAKPGDVEQLIVRNWTQVLGRAPSAGNADFFREGGDSLLGVRLLGRLSAQLQVEIDFADLFRHPTVEALTILLRHRLGPRAEDRVLDTSSRRIAPETAQHSVTRSRPASNAQQRLWFLNRYFDGSAAYSVPLAFRIRGPFSTGALDRALEAITARHEALRTGLAMVGERLMQVVGDFPTIRTEERRASSLDDAMTRAQTEVVRPFDLSQPPLLRSLLIRYASDEQLWVLNVHHAVCDAWSLGLLFEGLRFELAGCPKPTLGLQYGAFVDRQRAWLQGREAEAQRRFWREQLSGEPPALRLSHGSTSGIEVSDRGEIEALRIERSLAEKLRATAANHGTTPQVVALSAFAALLYRWTLQERIVIGVPTACRTNPDTESTIGFFANTLALRIDFDPQKGFDRLIGQVAERLAMAIAHQDLPFDEVVDALGLVERSGRNPLFQAMFVMQDTPIAGGFELPGVSVEEVIVHTKTAKVDLCCMLRSVDDRIEGEMEYCCDLLDGRDAARLARAFPVLLEAGTRNPATRLDELPMMTPDERSALVASINASHAVYDDPLPIHHYIRMQVERSPDAIAVKCRAESLCYRDLGIRADRVAGALAAAGVGPEQLVGVCMDRSVAMVVALLAVLEAGAGFVPLSPRSPISRNQAIVADAGIRHVISQPERVPELQKLGARLWIEQALPDQAAPISSVDVHPSNVAYVYYTSGSTGTPKGVLIDHQCAMSRLAWLRQRYPLGPGDAVLHKTPLVFDVAIWEILGPLMAGAIVLAADPEAEADVAHIGELLAAPGTVFAHFVPSMLDAYLCADPRRPGRDLKWVQISGEGLQGDLLRRSRAYSSIELHNCYGQTETSEVAAWEDDGRPVGLRAPIGRQVGIYRLFILDRNLEPVLPGMPGELCVAGLGGLARGYRGQPATTAQRFVPNPFAIEPGERLYRSGDLARVNADGALEFLGRLDRQIKIRGCRIEIAEIEQVLGRYRGVRACAVVPWRDQSGVEQLVAYVSGDNLSVGELGEHSEQHLSEYMLPAAYVLLDELPTTASGKLDRLGLPPPTAADFESRGGSEAPRAGIESELAGLWLDVLEIHQVGRRDSFFAIGGNSLKAIQVLNHIKSSFDVQVSVRAFFADPTIASLAKLVEDALIAMVGSMSDDDALHRLREMMS